MQRRGGDLRKRAASQLDNPWARSWLASTGREAFLRLVLEPLLDFYTRRRATGREQLSSVKGSAILVANHRSHIDTPVILAALPRRLRRRTVVAAAADYFYRNRLIAWLVSFVFNTIPLDRRGGGLDQRAAGHVDRLLDEGWNLLLYPEGTRSRNGGQGRVRRGAAVLAERHNLPIVPIRVSGTHNAMPPGRFWPKRRVHRLLLSRRHNVEISFGEPIPPGADATRVSETLQRFFVTDGAAATNGRNGHRRFLPRRARVGAGERQR